MSERLYKVGQTVDATMRSYGGGVEAARSYLSRALPLLDGRTPLELAQASSAGADTILNLMPRAGAVCAV